MFENGGVLLKEDKPNTQIETISIEEYLFRRKKIRKDQEEGNYSSEEVSVPFFCNL